MLYVNHGREYLKEIGTGANFPWAYWLEVVIMGHLGIWESIGLYGFGHKELVWATGGDVGIVSMSVGWEHDHLLDENWEPRK